MPVQPSTSEQGPSVPNLPGPLCLFLWHEPPTYWRHEHGLTGRGAAGFAINLVVLATTAGALAFLTYRYVELPAMSRKRRQVGPA